MPRKNRIDIPGIIQHVIARGIERRKIFLDDNDREYFLEHLGKILIKNEGKCYGWVLMPNHFHLVLMSGGWGLAKIMRQLLTRYAVYFNYRYKRSGHLFQNRYKSIVCQEDSYLMELVRYIHLNPLKASLVHDVRELSGYRWSGHRSLIGKEMRPWQVKDEVLSYFDSNEGEAVKKYEEYVQEGIKTKVNFEGGGLIRSMGGLAEVITARKDEHRQMYDDRILGDGEFVEEILKKHEADTEKCFTVKTKINSLNDLITLVAIKMKINKEDLRGNQKNIRLAKARSLISYVGQQYLEESGTSIGLALNKNRATMSIAYGRGKELLQQDEESKALLRDIVTI